VLHHPAHFIAFSGGIGLAPFAPGSFGALLAWPILWLVSPPLGGWSLFALIAVLFAVGVWACDVTGRALGSPDHGGMVWDETVAFLIVLFFVAPLGGYWQLWGFVLFRVFDIFKPPPIAYYDRVLKGGWGVMLDDLMAAFYTLIVLAIARTILE
jgi:phosphatidylglycerophosphatase A